MSSGGTDEFVIKKRRRRTAVDPCLGYYKRDVSSEESALQQCSSNGQEAVEVVQGDFEEKTAVSSDSAQAITSPLSEDAEIITVDDFLRQQATASGSALRHQKTYGRKRQRRIQFSSDDDEAENHSSNDCVPNIINPTISSSALQPRTPTKATQRKTKKMGDSSHKKRNSTKRLAFSKRIQRAAALSSVDVDDLDAMTAAPPSLLLVSRDQITPKTPVQDRRAKLVNPRIPRQLDTSFANKENTPSPMSTKLKAKACRPFLQWGSYAPQLKEILPTIPSSVLRTKSPPPRSMVTPLKLVPYEDHDDARAAKFSQTLFRKAHRVITSNAPQPNCQSMPSVSESNKIVNEDPFMPLSIAASEPHLKTYLPPELSAKHPNESINVKGQSLPSSPSSDFPGLLVSQTSDIPPSTNEMAAIYTSPPDGHGQGNGVNGDVNDSLLNLRATYASESGLSPDLEEPSVPMQRGSQLIRSHKPMRRIGTMLDGFMETAREVLLTQSQAQAQARDRLASDDVTFPSDLSRSRSRTSRPSSRRLVVSSPVKYTSHDTRKNSSTGKAGTQDARDDVQAERNLKARKVRSMPSVSAFLRNDSVGAGRVGVARCQPTWPIARPSRAPIQSIFNDSYFITAPGDHTSPEESALNLNAPKTPALFEYDTCTGYGVPNLFDLLEGAELGSHVNGQIILSPTV